MNQHKPSSHQSVDESMAKFEGRSTLKQYMPLKPIKRWIDFETGYLWQFELYQGKGEERPQDLTVGEHVVISRFVKVEGSQIFFDNFFTTTEQLEQVSEKNLLAAGRLSSNRKGVSVEIK